MRPTHPEDGSSRSFAVRLLATVAVAFALVSVSGYLLLEGALSGRQISATALHEVRLTLGFLALLAPIGGTAIFCLLGGGRLLREHRLVLSRATRDGLTDLANRRAFEVEFPDAVAAAMRYGEPLAVMLIDVDDLELIGERHGRAECETTLRVASGVLRSGRPSDRPYRITDDGFVLLVARTDAEGAHALARRLQRNFAEAGVQVSMGASALRPGKSAETLRVEAETALCVAKRQGGSRAVHFDALQALGPPVGSATLAGAGRPAGVAEL